MAGALKWPSEYEGKGKGEKKGKEEREKKEKGKKGKERGNIREGKKVPMRDRSRDLLICSPYHHHLATLSYCLTNVKVVDSTRLISSLLRNS